MCLEMHIFGLYVSRANLTFRVLRSTTMWRQALLYAAHARREPTSLDQVDPSVEEKRSEDDPAGTDFEKSIFLSVIISM
jgi:hypothetical protein